MGARSEEAYDSNSEAAAVGPLAKQNPTLRQTWHEIEPPLLLLLSLAM